MAEGFLNVSQSAVFLGTTVVVLTFAAAWWQHRRAQRSRLPSKWRKVGEISELFMYPMKSGKGFELKEAECTDLGMCSTDNAPQELRCLKDRFFMVYHEHNNNFTTCRKHQKLLLLKTSSAGKNVVVFDAPDVPQFRLKIPDTLSKFGRKVLTMWHGETIEAMDCGDEVAKWITRYLIGKEDTSMRLAYHLADRIPRRNVSVPPLYKFKKYYKKMRDEYTGTFSDLAAFMLITESSVADLNTRVPPELQNIPPKQFRPNIVVRGSNPYEEDEWDWVKIGDKVVLRGFKPCTRCTVTSMDAETGKREPKFEPLKTLKSYRQVKDPAAKKLEGEAPVLGLFLGLHVGGLVKVGDPIYVGDE